MRIIHFENFYEFNNTSFKKAKYEEKELEEFYNLALEENNKNLIQETLEEKQSFFRYHYPTQRQRLEFIHSIPEPKQIVLLNILETLSPNNP